MKVSGKTVNCKNVSDNCLMQRSDVYRSVTTCTKCFFALGNFGDAFPAARLARRLSGHGAKNMRPRFPNRPPRRGGRNKGKVKIANLKWSAHNSSRVCCLYKEQALNMAKICSEHTPLPFCHLVFKYFYVIQFRIASTFIHQGVKMSGQSGYLFTSGSRFIASHLSTLCRQDRNAVEARAWSIPTPWNQEYIIFFPFFAMESWQRINSQL